MKYTNNQIREMLGLRTRLEARIRELGGRIPDKWPWDETGEFRNLQLTELVEDLERAKREAGSAG